jgi:peptide/nickel transport system substrate-binding protein
MRVAALEVGEVHLADYLDTREVWDQLNANTDLIGFKVGRPGIVLGWHLNASMPPFDDVRVRQAIHYLIDKETAFQTLFGDFITPAYGVLSSNTWAYWPGSEDYYPYDPAKGLALLEEAGWTDSDGDGWLDKDGEKLSFGTLGLDRPTWKVAWEFFQAQLREYGIEYQPEFAEAGVVVEQCHGAKRTGCTLAWRSTDPSVLEVQFHSKNIGSGFAWSHLADDMLDQLLDDGAIEPDPDKRKQIYYDAQERLLDLALYIPMWKLPGVYGYDKAVFDAVHLPYPEYIWLYDAYVEE